MTLVKFGLFFPGKGILSGMASVKLPFSVNITFDETCLNDFDGEDIYSFLVLHLLEVVKNDILSKVFEHSSENYPGQVCLN